MRYSIFAGTVLLAPLVMFSHAVMAAKGGVTEASGFSGNVLFGAGYLDLENSYVAGNKLIDVKNNTISGYGSPKGESDSYPFFSGEVNYTFDDRLQAFLGSDLEDLSTLDMVQKLGVRKQWDGVGVMGGSLLMSNIPGEVWEDPYLLNASRSDTDRDSTGIQFDWYKILDSNFFLELNTREIDIDTEKSGQQYCNNINNNIADPTACANSLRRDGDDMRLTVGYRWENGNSVWQPEITAGEDDRDGNAISRDVMGLKLNYTYKGDVWTPVASLAYVDYEYDQANPIVGNTDADGYAVSLSLFRKLDMGDGNWSAVGNLLVSDVDSNADFNDTYAFGFNAGVNYAFGK